MINDCSMSCRPNIDPVKPCLSLSLNYQLNTEQQFNIGLLLCKGYLLVFNMLGSWVVFETNQLQFEIKL